MGKLNSRGVKVAVSSPVTSTTQAVTAMGGKGFDRDARSELFLLAVTNFVQEKTFHEAAKSRDDRFAGLVRQLAVEDFEWLRNLLVWLRTEGNLRTASIVGAAEAVAARTEANLHEENALLIMNVLRRADEPGEFLAYWHSTVGRSLPKSVRSGLGAATQNLYTEKSYLKWDSSAREYRMADVLRLTHVKPENAYREALHQHIVDERAGKTGSVEDLPVLAARKWLMDMPVAERRSLVGADGMADMLRKAGMTWEALAGWLQGPMDKAAWEAVIPSMGIMALIRNLRNFDQAGVSDAVAEKFIISRLSDSEEIRRSGLLPMQIHSAYRAAPSLRWSWPLEKALNTSLDNVPELKGRTLVLVDTSTSMNEAFSKDGTVKRWDAAVLFGVALARRCAEVDLVSYSSAQYYLHDAPGAKTKQFRLTGGEGLLKSIARWDKEGFFLGGGTDTAGAVRKHLKGHDRVVILTDEQAGHAGESVSEAVPRTTPLFTWNLAGYKVGHGESGVKNRYTYGGLTDSAFRQIALIESGRNGQWPWMEKPVQ